ncbi:divisome protein SepX/GlpR [Kitasatospora sp. HPMI-4]|uniref:divisome protein SepX/GlpR n=1 Tax=Kitasatospora sp. HPMI-4 TaxID=3448443 RepID=UPI003F1CC994
MSSSGLIYAVIVGAWAAYLVPMWLRRQDELNEARPTERFSTAIRLLAGRSALERRAARSLGDDDDSPASEPVPGTGSVDSSESADGGDSDVPSQAAQGAPHRGAQEYPGERRAQLLARRRRMVTTLFLAFAAGAVIAAVAGVAFLWVPAVPAALLTFYIGYLRRLERQRYEVKLDRARAAQAAERLRERERARAGRSEAEEGDGSFPTERGAEPATERVDGPAAEHGAERPAGRAGERTPERPADSGRPRLRVAGAGHREPAESSAAALAEATDHEEWVDGMRENGAAGPESWEPVPVPLPTYVTAPVAPRVTRGLDLNARDAWDSGRSAEPRRTPLFDQYAEAAPAAPEVEYLTRPRAANE